jgi:RsiW-degrading membrane proteinase PrsW (M82 family)
MTGRRGFGRRHAENILKHSGEGVAHVWADVRSFNFKWIVPYETAVSPRILRNPSTWVMLAFGFTPLLGDIVLTSLQQLVVSLVVYFALAWAAYFYVFVAERTTELKVGVATAAFTIVIGVPFGMLLKRTPPMSLFYGMTAAQGSFERLVGSILADGLNEELLKVLPLVLLAFRLGKIKKPLDGMFYGALSGLGFAVFEGYRYITHAQSADEVVFQALVRTTSLPFLHATFTAISGYFIALAVVNRRRRAALSLLGIATAAVLHGSYDFATGIVRVAVAAFAYLLFISYADRSQKMVEELEQAEAAPLQDMTGRGGVGRHHSQDILEQSGKAVAHVWADVRSFHFKWIVPYETTLSSKILRNPSTWVMLLFGFAPLLANTVFNSLE